MLRVGIHPFQDGYCINNKIIITTIIIIIIMIMWRYLHVSSAAMSQIKALDATSRISRLAGPRTAGHLEVAASAILIVEGIYHDNIFDNITYVIYESYVKQNLWFCMIYTEETTFKKKNQSFCSIQSMPLTWFPLSANATGVSGTAGPSPPGDQQQSWWLCNPSQCECVVNPIPLTSTNQTNLQTVDLWWFMMVYGWFMIFMALGCP